MLCQWAAVTFSIHTPFKVWFFVKNIGQWNAKSGPKAAYGNFAMRKKNSGSLKKKWKRNGRNGSHFAHTHTHSAKLVVRIAWLPIWCSHAGEDTSASPCGVDTTRGAAVTGYKPSHDWRKARRQGLLPTLGGIGSHWTAIARLKLDSPPDRKVLSRHGLLSSWGAPCIGIRNHSKSSLQPAHQATKEKNEKRPALKLEEKKLQL